MRDSYYKSGGWNIECSWCGEKKKNSQVRKTWDGYYVCFEHWEPRQPLDFLKGIEDKQSVPFSQPAPPINQQLVCTTNGTSAISGYAVAGCSIAGRTVVMGAGNS